MLSVNKKERERERESDRENEKERKKKEKDEDWMTIKWQINIPIGEKAIIFWHTNR